MGLHGRTSTSLAGTLAGLPAISTRRKRRQALLHRGRKSIASGPYGHNEPAAAARRQFVIGIIGCVPATVDFIPREPIACHSQIPIRRLIIAAGWGGDVMSWVRIFLLGGVSLALVALGRPAAAADMGLVLKAPATAPVFDWTGFYVGGHVGYARGNARVNLADDEPANFTSSFGTLTGGLQGGYNYVLPSRLLLGIEADMSFPNWLAGDDLAWFRTTPDTDIAEKIDYMGTLRGRLGYAFDHWMVYATGGFAWSLGRYLQTPGSPAAHKEHKVISKPPLELLFVQKIAARRNYAVLVTCAPGGRVNARQGL